MMKRCSSCREDKDPSLFYRDKNRKDGRNCECAACQRIRKVEYNRIARERRANIVPTDGISWKPSLI